MPLLLPSSSKSSFRARLHYWISSGQLRCYFLSSPMWLQTFISSSVPSGYGEEFNPFHVPLSEATSLLGIAVSPCHGEETEKEMTKCRVALFHLRQSHLKMFTMEDPPPSPSALWRGMGRGGRSRGLSWLLGGQPPFVAFALGQICPAQLHLPWHVSKQ